MKHRAMHLAVCGTAIALLTTSCASPSPKTKTATPVVVSSQLDGTWHGAITVPGQQIEIIVKITTIDGNIIATMDIPEQSTVDLPLHDVRLELPKVHFELLAEPNLAVLDGALKPDGTIAGTFTQSGVEGTFVLAPQEAASAATPTPSGMVVGKIDVGGYKLFYTCRGQGSPALILEAGGGSTSFSWSKVMDGVYGTTRVCAYDRANLGHSDKAPTPRTYQDMVRDLHALLVNAHIDGPYILAGHSMGGLLVRAFADQHRKDVAGIVLVDSAYPDMGPRLLVALPPASADESDAIKAWRQWFTLMSSNGQEPWEPEGVDFQASHEQFKSVKPLGDLPLVVISRSPNNTSWPGMPPLPAEINTKLLQIWDGLQVELAGLSSNSTRVIATRAGHDIPGQEPELVVNAALKLVNEAREGPGASQTTARLKTIDGKSISVAELESFIEQTMEKADVAGLSCAILNDSQVVYQKAFGYRNKSDGTRNDAQTVFSAASFSKTVFAYLVMLLAEEKVIDLDRPLHEYLDKPLYEYPAYADLKGDDRYRLITARMALSHSTGFPNLRYLTQDGKLRILFTPGSRHSYSGEGIALLQMIVESVTGKNLETLAQEKVFQPLGMARSSYVWQPQFEANYASPHDEYGKSHGVTIQSQSARPDAVGSMVTTAGDYARFLTGILNAGEQHKTTVNEMLRSQIAIDYKRMFGPDAWTTTDENQAIHLAWGLGWGRFDTPAGRAFFHTGHSIGWQNYTVTYIDKGIGIVLMSNSDNFESVAEEIAGKAIGDIYSPFDWLGYVPFDPSRVKKTPPPSPELVAIEVDPAILAEYAGAYDMQPTATFHIKFEDNRLFVQSLDGKSWEPLLAETETRFFVRSQEDYRFNFIRDGAGKVSALQLVYQGIEMPLAKKVE